MGIGGDGFIAFKHKLDFAFKRSTRLLLIVIAKVKNDVLAPINNRSQPSTVATAITKHK